MAVVGAFARIQIESAPGAVSRLLDELPGVSTFDLGTPEKVGILIEAQDVDSAHATLTGPVRNVEGVLGVWPVYVHLEEETESAGPESARGHAQGVHHGNDPSRFH